jgi:hypothetical protein
LTNSLRKLVILVIVGHLDIFGKWLAVRVVREFRVVRDVEANDQWPY